MPGGDALLLEKEGYGEYSFDDGVVFKFAKSQPRHVQFHCKTNESLAESCNLRLFARAQEQGGSSLTSAER